MDKKYDLLERTENFSLSVRDFCIRQKQDTITREYIVQLVRSAGSVAANYVEASEHLGEKGLIFRIKVCRKESKESQLWLKHIITNGSEDLEKTKLSLLQESLKLERIFGAILKKLTTKAVSKAS
ncbi:MAG: four helix bundle protein [Chitinophagaceae bacterium]|nr:four helix bundle protein [Chitinophagaceae bacterium]